MKSAPDDVLHWKVKDKIQLQRMSANGTKWYLSMSAFNHFVKVIRSQRHPLV